MKDINGILEILQLPEIEDNKDRKNAKTKRAYNNIICNILKPENIEEAMEYLNAINTRLETLRNAMRESIINTGSCHPEMPETIRAAFTELNRWISFYHAYSKYVNSMIMNTELPDSIKIPSQIVREKYCDLVSRFSSVPTAVFTLYSKNLEKSDLALCGNMYEIATVYYFAMNHIYNEITRNAAADEKPHSVQPFESYFDEVNLRICMKEERMIPPNATTSILDYKEFMKTTADGQMAVERYDYYQEEIIGYLNEGNPNVKIYLLLETEILETDIERLYLISNNHCFNVYGAWTTGNKYLIFRDDKKLRNEYIENTMRALHTNNQFGKTKLGISYSMIRKVFTDKNIQEKTRIICAGDDYEV